MKYIFAFLCPPYGLVVSEKPVQAVVCVLLESLALATWTNPCGLLIHATCILWAIHAVGSYDEEGRVSHFVKELRRRHL